MVPSIRLLAVDIDGTLLNSEFQISQADLAGLRRAHQSGVEVVLVTGRRHSFALPIAERLGFDLWLISSNGAVTRSLAGENFHRDLLPAETCRLLCRTMQEFRGNLVLTFDKETKGALVLERMDELTSSIQSWLEKNIDCIEFVYRLRRHWSTIPYRPCFADRSMACGGPAPCLRAASSNHASPFTGPNTRNATLRSWMC